ncbi:DUF3139 domain-containing protein [Staphylococcus massiliensis]|uniref:DUF3139 domain-containing protein n=1 Tax=Staphylococcus massiliensis S46 TaxID=1229783 RepID=K9AL40_9STAP|nr:DUF3139 domain-containing protein [Staphylococcus massiliensis]EKU46776.1 hypothetical protein C273_08731 [Staphylococcus massiliensis S46]MCG3399308.1 DUF3139 domain-containing protein [Staphylococcus massiliensis]MCG3402380.1 DUF3139 domain-containing protein [Staphylococcus massiliensis]MCG3411655.1 DUF3139 domain-containing protein [Staphylococcus massiliensis]PNZ99221.1 DUF3139 domain-containing protein [Staphylococcus massiliensis CCUG 55927]
MKKYWKLIIILILIFILCGLGFFGFKGYQKHQNLAFIDSFVKDKGWDKDIKSEKSEYDARKGIFFKEIQYKDEPNLTYIVQPIKMKKGIYSQGFDKKTKKSKKDAKRNFFSQEYKKKD